MSIDNDNIMYNNTDESVNYKTHTSFTFYIKDSESLKALKEECKITRLSNKKLQAKYYDNAIVLESKGWIGCKLLGGVQDCNGNFIINTSYCVSNTLTCNYEISINDIKKDKIAIFIGYLYPVWGHVISDALAKLWFLRTEECNHLLKQGAKIIYLTEFNKPLPSWNKEIIGLAGYNIDDWVHVTDSTLYDTVIVPDDSLFPFDNKLFYTVEFMDTINSIKNNVKIDSQLPEKVYYTRSAIKDYREWGREKDVEKLFKSKGFTVISPEKNSIQCQIAMMMHCKEFASTENSCSHNSLFCTPATKVYILRKADYINKYTSMIGYFAQLRTIYVDANASTRADAKYPMLGPFFIMVTKELKAALGSNEFTIPYYMNINYWGGYIILRPIIQTIRQIKYTLCILFKLI